MRSFLAVLARLMAGLGLLAGGLGLGAPGATASLNALRLPPHLTPVSESGAWAAEQAPGSLQTGTVQMVVHLNLAPLAVVGKYWSHSQRRAYIAEITAAQDKLQSEIEALGGQVAGRFYQLATGLAVTVDAAQVEPLRRLANVVAVTSVANYTLQLDEIVPWVGGAPLHVAGLTGQGVDIAIIDSGVDYTHAKLGGSGEPADYAACATDPDSLSDCSLFPNAKVAGGRDWVGELWPNPDPRCGLDASGNPRVCPQVDADPLDAQGHGTHVADIAAGRESAPGAGDAGMAPGARLWAFKACSASTGVCNGLALLQALDDAMDLDDSDRGACTPGVDAGCAVYDPADVVNLSLGMAYGQPEETLTHLVNLASYYGAVVVAAAGNGGDRPYIVSSPSTAAGALSVAQSATPDDTVYRVVVGGVNVLGFHQRWSPAPAGTLTGVVQVGDGAGGNLDGCLAFAPGSLAGKAVLLDRGGCAVSLKGANASAGGAALVLVADNQFANTPPGFAYGGGDVRAPVLTLTQADGLAAKAEIGKAATVSESSFICIVDDIIASSSRGPRIADGGLKPDLAAPGASRSALVGSGAGRTEFGGTSGAAPLTAGAAALLVQSLQARGLWTAPDPGVGATGISVAPLVKALLMNTAQPNTTIGAHFLAPITLQGAGRLEAQAAAAAGSLALDVTELYNWAATRAELPCAITSSPTNGVVLAAPPSYYNGSHSCLSAYPFGNDFFNAWNALTGSLSFGYDGVAGSASLTRKVMIQNLSDTARTYRISSAFRYADDDTGAVTLTASPAQVTVPARGYSVVDVTLRISAKGLRQWTLDAGRFGDHGTRLECAGADPAADCPTLTMFEYDGFLVIDGGAQNTLRLPWQVLPKKAAQVEVARVDASSVKLRNAAGYEVGQTDVFALVEVSPNKCEIVGGGLCVEANYQPGVLPGINGSFVDLNEVGLRSYPVAGLNASFGLPAAPAGALADEVIEFAVTVYDKPYRASHNFPVELDVFVDADRDGRPDYVVFNADLALDGSDGRNAVFVRDVNPADGTRATRAFFFSVTDFNSQNWILPVPAAAIDARSDQPFSFQVQAFDAYFTTSAGPIQDCSPADCRASHVIQTGLLKYQPAIPALRVAPLGYYTLPFSQPAGGAAASPSQIGLVFLHRAAPVGAESQSVVLP